METDNKTAPVSAVQDQNQISLDLMNRMKMHGMAEAFRESLAGTTAQSMTPDSFLSMLLAREWDWRAQAAIARLTRNASFRYKAYMEEIDYTVSRGLDRNQMERLATLDFVRQPVKSILNLPDNMVPFNLIPIGHPLTDHVPMDKWHPDRVHQNRLK